VETLQISLPAEQMVELRALAAIEHTSSEDLIRKAVTAYVERNKPAPPSAFGIWKDRVSETGVEYQERLRTEW
jgi:hypothetical protein